MLEARAAFADSSLADLYDPLAMPPALVKAHQVLDKAVDACYGRQAFVSDAQRVAYLFELYQQITSLLPAPAGKRRQSKPAAVPACQPEPEPALAGADTPQIKSHSRR